LLEPVDIKGAKISRASLHNQDEIDKKDIRIGDHVIIQRAGDVIPEVIKPIPDKRTGEEEKFHLPEKCPVCGEPVKRPEDEAIHRCVNISCPARVKESIKHFASKGGADIEGLGDKLVEQLVDEDLVENIADLYRLEHDEIADLDRMGDKSADNLIEALEKSKDITFARLVYALGIRHVGEHLASILTGHYRDFDQLREATNDELTEINEIGPEVAGSIKNFFSNEKNLALLDQLEEVGVEYSRESGEEEDILEGLRFVFTGRLDDFTRSEAERAVEKLGGRATSSVSSVTDYLVAGENPGSKYEEAQNQGAEIIDEAKFKEMIRTQD